MTISRTRKTSFVGDALKLVSGTTFAQTLSIVVSPILARLYDPETFGIAALFVSITGVITVISCMRYESAIVLPERDEEAANLLGLSLGFVVLISSLAASVVWFGQMPIIGWLKAPALAPYLWLIAPMVFLNGVFLALNYWNSRTKHFWRLSIAQVITSFATAGGKVGAGIAGYATESSLIGATILGSATSTTVLGGQIWRDDSRLLRQSINWRGTMSALKRYYKFPAFSTWTALLNTLSWQLPILMLSAFFSPAVVGFYSFGNRLLRTPIMLVGRSVAQVFYQRAAVANDAGDLDAVVLAVYNRLVAYGLFPMLLMTIIGKELFVTIFGEKWADAGIYSQILSVYMFFNFISAPLGQLFSVLEKQEVALITNISLLLSRAGALWLGGSTGNVLFTLTLFSVSGVLVYGGYSMWIIRAAGIPLTDWWRILLRSALTSGVFLIAGWLLGAVFHLHSWRLLAAYGICAVVYYVWLLSTDRQIVRLAQSLYAGLPRAGGK
jgi:lipopolysaccharide exporter